MSTLMNLSDIKHKEKLLRDQTRLAQMGEMISMIAHQWRQPLGAISSSIFSIQTKRASGKFDLTLQKDRDKFFAFSDTKLEHINEYVQVLSSTIDDFRTFFSQDKHKEPVPLSAPLKRALHIVENSIKSKNIKLVTHYNDEQKLLLYQNEIMQVILNILKNAEDNFVEKGTKEPLITIVCEKDWNDEHLITISDNGGGIPKDILPKIFDPYFSTKNEKNGTGLGLYMSKTIVQEHHQGKLTVCNNKDGAVFKIAICE